MWRHHKRLKWSKFDNPWTEEHNNHQDYGDEGQHNDAAHPTSAFLHRNLGFVDIRLGPLNVVIGSSHSLTDLIDLFPALMSEDADDFQQLKTLVDLLFEVFDVLQLTLDISDCVGEERRVGEQSFFELFLFFLLLGDFSVEFQLQIDLVLDSSEEFLLDEVVLGGIFLFLAF